jgi:hypothetical protein
MILSGSAFQAKRLASVERETRSKALQAPTGCIQGYKRREY